MPIKQEKLDAIPGYREHQSRTAARAEATGAKPARVKQEKLDAIPGYGGTQSRVQELRSALTGTQTLHGELAGATSFGSRLSGSEARMGRELRRGSVQVRLDDNEREMKSLQDEINAQQKLLKRTQASYGRARDQYTAGSLMQRQTEQQAALDASRKRLEELTAKQAELQGELADAKYAEWAGLTQRPDFAEKSRYVSTANGTERKFSPVTGTYTGTGYGDVYYDYINGNKTAQDTVLLEDVKNNTSHEGWKDLPRETVRLFNYIYATQGKDAAYEFLNEAAQRKYTGMEALALNFAEGTGALSLGAALGSIGGGKGAGIYGQLQRQTQEASAQHEGLARAGRIGGSLAFMYGIGAGAGALAAKAGLPYIAEKAAVGALSFAGADAVQNAGAAAVGQISAEDYLKSLGISAAQGAAGGAAGAYVGSGLASMLEKHGLMTPFMEFVRQTASGVTESTVNQASGYIMRGQEPTREELAEGLVTAFAFSVLTSAVSTLKMTQAQKANMAEAQRVLTERYTELIRAADGMTPEQTAQQAQLIKNEVQSTRDALKGVYIAGQQKNVNKIYAALDMIDELMDGYLSGSGAQSVPAVQAGTGTAALPNAAQRPTESVQGGTDIAAAAQASTGTARPAGQQNAAPRAGAADAGGIQANNLANARAGNLLRENAAQEGYSGGTSDSLRSFIENTRSMDEQERARQHTDLDTQTTRAQETAEQLTGVATDGSRIGGSAVTYIDSRYGANGTANHSMESIDDFSRMGYVLDNFTDVRLLNADELDAGAAKLIREFGGSAVRFSMPVDGGNYIVEAVPDSNTKKLSVVSAYMSSAAEGNVQQNGAAEAGSALPVPAVSTLENLRDGENGWGTHYRMAAEALEAGMKELAPGLWREYSGEEYTPECAAIVLAILRVSRDVDSGSVSPAKALRYLERAYKSGGMEAIERIGAADGTYAPRAGETVTLPTAEQELDRRNGGKLNGQKQTETDSTGRERTETDGGDQISDRDGGRDADKRSGGKAGVVERSGAGRADAGRKAIERQNRGRRLPLERVSSHELGLKWGTENPSVRLLPAEAWDEGLRQTAERLERETGCRVTYVLGGMEIEDPDGETHTVRGVITPEQILIQADCMSATAEQIGDHELFHYYADSNPGLISSVREEITEKYGREEFDEIVGRYIERLHGIIDVSESPFADAQDAVLEDIENEIFADAYAGINAFGAHAERYQGDVRSVTERRGVTSRQASEATERRTGPPAGEDEYLQLLREQLRSGEITDSEYDRLFDEYYQGGSEGRYSYAGEKARGADLEALKRAKEMQREGVANDVIRRETGWYAGMDGKWRFEIDDSGMEFRRDGDARLMQEPGYCKLEELTDKWGKSVSGGAELTEAEEAELERLQEKYSDAVWEEKYMLTDFLKHDALFEAYPQLRGVSLAFDSLDGGTKGYFRKRDNTIVLSDSLFGKDADTLIHEIQHVIQSVEGFSPGASPEYWARREYETGDLVTERPQREYSSLLNSLPREDANRYIRYNELERELERLFLADESSEDGRRYTKLEKEQDALYEELYPNEWFRQLLELNRRMTDAPGEYLSMYRNTAGEIEARDAAGRRSLTAAERRERMPDLGDENTVFAGGSGESYSIANTRNMPWKGQVRGYFSNDGTIKSSDSLYLGESGVEGVDNAPIYIPTSVITKAIRPPKGSRSAHALSQKNILNLQESIKNAPVVIDNPARNGIVYVTADQDSAGNYIIAALDKNNDLYGENAHKVTSIHGRENIAAMLEKLGDDATIFVKNENKLNHMLPGNQILKSLALRAKVELDDSSISDRSDNVKSPTLEGVRFSVSDEENSTERETQERGADAESVRTALPKKAQNYLRSTERTLVNRIGNALGVPKLARREYLDAIVKEISSEYLRSGRVSAESANRLFDRAYDEGIVVDEEFYRQYKDLKDRLRTMRVSISEKDRADIAGRHIYVPEEVKHEFGDDWNDFRKRAFGAGVMLTNDRNDTGADVVNMELSESVPWIFDPQETDSRTILERIVQAAEEGKAEKMSLGEYIALLAELEYVSEDELLEGIERQVDWALRTFAEKAKLEIELRDRTGIKIAQEREKAAEQTQRQRNNEIIRRADERAKRSETVARQRANRELKELQQKTLKQLQWLAKNRQRAPKELRGAWDDILSDMDIYAVNTANEMRWSGRHNATWKDLAQMYKDARENDPNFLPSKELEKIVARLDNKKIAELDFDALGDLYKAAVGLRTEFYNR